MHWHRVKEEVLQDKWRVTSGEWRDPNGRGAEIVNARVQRLPSQQTERVKPTDLHRDGLLDLSDLGLGTHGCGVVRARCGALRLRDPAWQARLEPAHEDKGKRL